MPNGFQEGKYYPKQPRTAADFAKLLKNPNKPAENQSAPTHESLNPHLFGDKV